MRVTRTVLIGSALLTVAAAPSSAQQLPPANTDFVFVDSQEILPNAPGAAEAQQAFDLEMQQFQAELQGFQTEIDSLMATYRQQEAMLSQTAKDQRQQEILAKQQQAQDRQNEMNEIANQRQAELLQPIVDNVNRIIEEIRTENNYQLVLDASAPGVIAWSKDRDITQVVLARLRSEATASADPGG